MAAARTLLLALVAAVPALAAATHGARDAGAGDVLAQAQRKAGGKADPKRPPPQPAPATPPAAPAEPAPGAGPTATATAVATPVREKIEADVSARAVAITSGFMGTRIVVFGAVDNSRQPSAESGFYDVIVVVEGNPAHLVARRKSNVAGLWVNTASAVFDQVPSYYAVASTRPVEEIAEPSLLATNAIGHDHALLVPSAKAAARLPPPELAEFREAIVRIKRADGLYIRDDYGVAFIGRSLFRSSIDLPPNVPVGSLTAHVYLLREGELLSTVTTQVALEREGLDLVIYEFAMNQPLAYGLVTVLLAIAAGLIPFLLGRRWRRT